MSTLWVVILTFAPVVLGISFGITWRKMKLKWLNERTYSDDLHDGDGARSGVFDFEFVQARIDVAHVIGIRNAPIRSNESTSIFDFLMQDDGCQDEERVVVDE